MLFDKAGNLVYGLERLGFPRAVTVETLMVVNRVFLGATDRGCSKHRLDLRLNLMQGLGRLNPHAV
jgi:hypothetical protein